MFNQVRTTPFFALLLLLAAPVAPAQEVPEALLEKAESEEVVRVIVELDVDARPEEALTEAGIRAQRAAIAQAQEAVLEVAGAEAQPTLMETAPLIALDVTADELERLAETDAVVRIVEDELAQPMLAQSVPLINAPDAWNAGFEGSGLMVAILDTGVDSDHPFFGGRVTEQGCFSTTSAANGGSASFCPDGSGSQTGGNSGQDCPLSVAGCGHGTHVAGIAAGSESSFSGVAPEADIAAGQVFSRFNSASVCSPRPAPCALSYTSDQIKGLEWVKSLAPSHTIAAVNMSLGGGKSSTACDTDSRKPVIDELRALLIATVVASGNNGFDDGISKPACISSAVSVGSTSKSDVVSGFSNSAPILDLLAPGQSINSSLSGGGFGTKSGTSMATPHVTGAFAVIRSAMPAASVTQIVDRLEADGVPVSGKGVTKPRIDLAGIADHGIVPSAGALAYGTVWFNGAKQKGTPNWSSSYNPTYNRYEIVIDGQNYYYLNYTTAITPAGDTRFCKSSSVGGKLLVYCYDHNGAPATSRFGFVTYKN